MEVNIAGLIRVLFYRVNYFIGLDPDPVNLSIPDPERTKMKEMYRIFVSFCFSIFCGDGLL